MPAPILQLEAISKRYPGGTQALDNIHLSVFNGEILCLLGPSGCGKTTLLRVIAGLETPDTGRVLFGGNDIAKLPVHKRGFGFMFQDFALFPHRTVSENIAFGLQMAGWPRTKQDERVATMLEMVNLPGYGNRTIFELSGGERQRVALARSLAPNPALLMLDEPLGSLDRGLREELVEELRSILNEMKVTALYVTHDQDEAMALGDRLVIMQKGHIEQIGTPSEVYTQPATAFVARFLGFSNLIPATATEEGVTTPFGPFPITSHTGAHQVTLLLRQEAARLTQQSLQGEFGFHLCESSKDEVLLHGRLLSTAYHGNTMRIEVDARSIVVPESKAPVFVFNLPLFQQSAQPNALTSTQLPSVGEPITLAITTALATILPFSIMMRPAQ